MSRATSAIAWVFGATCLGCVEPTARPWPAPSEMQLFMVLDPDSSVQALRAQLLWETIGGLPTISASIALNGQTIADASVAPQPHPDEGESCIGRYGITSSFSGRCLRFGFAPQPGTEYSIAVSAPGRPVARARTVVPGSFELTEHAILGSLPGTVRLTATWTASAGVHRYVVTIGGRQSGPGSCRTDASCFKRWFASTTDTSISATVDASHFERATGPWTLNVYAMNQDVYGYIMTGGPNDLFPIAPRQNVDSGYGAVGAWVVRSVPLM